MRHVRMRPPIQHTAFNRTRIAWDSDVMEDTFAAIWLLLGERCSAAPGTEWLASKIGQCGSAAAGKLLISDNGPPPLGGSELMRKRLPSGVMSY